MEKIIENNQVTISGRITSSFVFSHEVFGEGFYIVDVEVERMSGTRDCIPVMVSERLIDVTNDLTGYEVTITGQFRSFNRCEGERSRLILSVFARTMVLVNREAENTGNNSIFLDGFICKPPVYRKTPLGREIADVLIAVNRPYGKSDCIPCICWGRNARFASSMDIGARVCIWGRIQSREYVKRLDETHTEERVAYEVSVSKIEG